MKTSLTVNNNNIPLNDFTQRYIANMLAGMANSFGMSSSKVTVSMDAERFSILTDNGDIDISKKDFARQLIESTIKGMLSPLKGVFWLQNITIMSEGLKVSVESLKDGLTDR